MLTILLHPHATLAALGGIAAGSVVWRTVGDWWQSRRLNR